MELKLAFIYYSSTGSNYQLCQWGAEGAKKAGADVRIVRVQELAPASAIASNPAWQAHVDATQDVPVATMDDLEWADAIIFSFPTRYGGVPSQMKQFIDSTGGLWFQGKLVNKVVSAMTSAQNPHGGQEATLLSFYVSMFHWGAIIAAPGYTSNVIYGAGGNPYGTSATVSAEGITNDAREAAIHQAERTATIARYVKSGMQQQ